MELIINVLAKIEIMVFLRKILRVELAKSKLKRLVGLAILLLAVVIYTFFPDENIAMIVGNVFVKTIGFCVIVDESVLRAFLKTRFASIYVCFFYAPFRFIVLIVEKVFAISLNENVKEICLVVTVIVLMHIIAMLLEKQKQIIYWIRRISPAYFCIAIVYGDVVNMISSYIKLSLVNDGAVIQLVMQGVLFVLSIFMYIFGIGFALVDLWRKQYKQTSELKDEYMQMAKSNYDRQTETSREVRRIRHDIKAHMNALNSFARENEWDKLKGYLADMNESHEVINVKVPDTGNVFVNGVISSGLQDTTDIALTCTGRFNDEVGVSDFDLCCIFSNLLSNSIEACNRLTKTEKIIDIKLSSDKSGTVIIFENPEEGEVDINKLGRCTSKKDKESHGYGLENIKLVVEKYGGYVDIEVSESIFRIKVFFF